MICVRSNIMGIRVADYIADWLVKNSIKHVFSVTGGGAMHLNDALGNHPKLTCIYNHHEQASAMAAEGYYKALGRLPAVCVTTGPGGTNALTGVLGAWLDSVPMIVISGQVRLECTIRSEPKLKLRQLGDQEFNILDTVKPMTKYAAMVTDPGEIKYHLEKALFLARNGRPGPVWLDIPLDIQAAPTEPARFHSYDEAEDKSELYSDLTAKKVREIIKQIEAAKRPVIIAGAGVRLAGADKQFNKLIKQLHIPVMTAWNSHDLVEDSNPLYAGRPGTVGTRGGNFVFQNADLLLVMGCRMNLRQIGYAKKEIAPRAFKIMIDIDRAELQKKTFQVDMPVQCNCAAFIDKMIHTGYRKHTPGNDRWIQWCREINLKYSPLRDIKRKTGRLNPYLFFDRLYKTLPEGQITVTANGSACVISFQTAEIKKGQRLFTNSGCASMGYGLPAAIGACVASGGKRVVCIEGDGSLQMNIQELQTVIHNNLPLRIFVINNNGYHSIRQTQANFFKSRFAGIDKTSGLSFPDLSGIAAAYGFNYYIINSEKDAGKTITRVLASKKPVICEVVVDPEQNFVPKSASKILPDGNMSSAPLHDMYPFLSDRVLKECMITDEIDEIT
jgi:acetolactate synthase I/II/III large subunit